VSVYAAGHGETPAMSDSIGPRGGEKAPRVERHSLVKIGPMEQAVWTQHDGVAGLLPGPI